MKNLVTILDTVLLVGFCALLGFGPLAFGAVQNWAICVLEASVAGLLGLWALREMVETGSRVVWSPILAPCAVFGGLIAVQLTLGRSAYWHATWSKAMLWAAYGTVVFLTPQILRRRKQIESFAIFLSVYGFLVAVFGVVQQLSWNGRIYWTVENRAGGWVYGPYVNHAHYAGLIELLAPISILFAVTGFLSRPLRALALFDAVMMSSTLFMSQSLGGILSFTAQVVVMLTILRWRAPKARRQMFILGLLCLLLAVSLVALRPKGLVHRLAQLRDPLSKSFAADRLAILTDSVKLVKQRPVLGWGLGTFPVVYPSFRSFYSDFWVNEAHNDYAQILVETGVLGFGAALYFLFVLYRRGTRHVSTWRQDPISSIRLGALVGCTGLLVHALCDFNLQIPANALLFFALAALASAPHNFSYNSNQRKRVTGFKSTHTFRTTVAMRGQRLVTGTKNRFLL